MVRWRLSWKCWIGALEWILQIMKVVRLSIQQLQKGTWKLFESCWIVVLKWIFQIENGLLLFTQQCRVDMSRLYESCWIMALIWIFQRKAAGPDLSQQLKEGTCKWSVCYWISPLWIYFKIMCLGSRQNSSWKWRYEEAPIWARSYRYYIFCQKVF